MQENKIGDLYALNLVDHFRMPVEYPVLSNTRYPLVTDIKKADSIDIFYFGDSFTYRFQKLPVRMLSNELAVRVFYAISAKPQYVLQNQPSGMKKVAVLQIVEREIASTYGQKQKRNQSKPGFLKKLQKKTAFLNKDGVFTAEQTYQYIFKHIKIFRSVSRFINSLRFNAFGLISEKTPYYSKNPPMLFYYQTTNHWRTSYFYQHSAKEIQTYANSIEKISSILKHDHNIELVFMPVPNKISIYHELVTNHPYNELLPGLYKALDKRDINFVDLYHPFRQHREMNLYYPNDTHWNYEGMKLATKLLIEKIRTLP